MKFHEKIYHCRKKSGMSQEELAEKLGVSRQAVSKWETGEAVPEFNKVKQLKEIFDVSFDWLLSENDEAETNEAKTVQTENTFENKLMKQNQKFLNIYLKTYMILCAAMLLIIGCGLIVFTIYSISFYSYVFFLLIGGGLLLLTASGLIIRYLIKNKRK